MGLVVNHLKEIRQAKGITQVQMAADQITKGLFAIHLGDHHQ